MSETTINAFNSIVDKISQQNTATLIVLIVLFGLFYLITDRRARSRDEDNRAKREQQNAEFIKTILEDRDSKTAVILGEIKKGWDASTTALENNNKALDQRKHYNEMQLTAMQENVAETRALRIDIAEWPKATNTSLEILIAAVKEMQGSVSLLITAVSNQRDDAKELQTILKPIPAQLKLLQDATKRLLEVQPTADMVFEAMRRAKEQLPHPKDEIVSAPDEPPDKIA